MSHPCHFDAQRDFAFTIYEKDFLAGGSNDKHDQSLPSGFEFIVPKCSRR
jgi:hypothetical protein